jgi:hypothetical protein
MSLLIKAKLNFRRKQIFNSFEWISRRKNHLSWKIIRRKENQKSKKEKSKRAVKRNEQKLKLENDIINNINLEIITNMFAWFLGNYELILELGIYNGKLN